MSDFAYVVSDTRLLPDLGERPFNYELVVSGHLLRADPSPGDNIWLILNFRAAFHLFGIINVSSCELLTENRIVISGNMDHSRYLANPKDGPVLKQEDFPELQNIEMEKYLEIDSNQLTILEALEKSCWSTIFGTVPAKIQVLTLQSIASNYANETLAWSAIQRVLRLNYLESELSFDPWQEERRDPFMATAKILLQHYLRSSAIRIGANVTSSNVDMNLVRLTPSSIKARIFNPSSQLAEGEALANRLAAVSKLDDAERRHQEILLDCFRELNAMGIKALSSESVDLAFVDLGVTRIFEIKSATFDNFSSQFEHGLIQIAKYRWAFKLRSHSVSAGLIIELPDGGIVDPELEEFASSLDIDLFFWDSSKPWPERVSGFLFSHSGL